MRLSLLVLFRFELFEGLAFVSVMVFGAVMSVVERRGRVGLWAEEEVEEEEAVAGRVTEEWFVAVIVMGVSSECERRRGTGASFS